MNCELQIELQIWLFYCTHQLQRHNDFMCPSSYWWLSYVYIFISPCWLLKQLHMCCLAIKLHEAQEWIHGDGRWFVEKGPPIQLTTPSSSSEIEEYYQLNFETTIIERLWIAEMRTNYKRRSPYQSSGLTHTSNSRIKPRRATACVEVVSFAARTLMHLRLLLFRGWNDWRCCLLVRYIASGWQIKSRAT